MFMVTVVGALLLLWMIILALAANWP